MAPNPILTVRPEAPEYAPYYGKYISLVPEGDILKTLETQLTATQSLLAAATAEQADYRYAAGKWSVKEVLGHISDTERIMGYRALRMARNDRTPIEGFEQDDYVRHGSFGRRPLADLLEEFTVVRRGTLCLFRGLDEEAWRRRGIANQNEVSVRALAFIMAGHELHHVAILRDAYRLGRAGV